MVNDTPFLPSRFHRIRLMVFQLQPYFPDILCFSQIKSYLMRSTIRCYGRKSIWTLPNGFSFGSSPQFDCDRNNVCNLEAIFISLCLCFQKYTKSNQIRSRLVLLLFVSSLFERIKEKSKMRRKNK